MKIIFLGPQASGKGTQASALAQKLQIPHISSGDIFRSFAKQPDTLGKKIKKLLQEGKFIPDEITNQVIQKRLAQADAQKGFILDGYPRRLAQAKFLASLTSIDLVFYLKISDQEVIKRVSQRRICSQCGAVYNLDSHPPKKKGVCDLCGGKLIKRADDQPAALRERLKIYHQETEPLVAYYQEQGILKEINGAQPIKKVFQDILKALKE